MMDQLSDIMAFRVLVPKQMIVIERWEASMALPDSDGAV